MKFQIDIDLPVPRGARNAILVLLPIVLVVATTAIVRASVPNVFVSGETLSAQKMNDNFIAISPAGMIAAWAGTCDNGKLGQPEGPPAGWLCCDGSAQSRVTYAPLFQAIKVAWGFGDNATTFNLPDLRGRFLRGADDGNSSNDPGPRAPIQPGANATGVGSLEQDAFQTHKHSAVGETAARQAGPNTGWGISAGQALPGADGVGAPNSGRVSTETRPVNAAVNYIIKY